MTLDTPSAPAALPSGQVPPGQTPFEQRIAVLLVSTLHLETAAADIPPDEALFGEGLGLDSIDALELSLAVSREFGIEMRSDDGQNQAIFASLRSLSAHVEAHRTK